MENNTVVPPQEPKKSFLRKIPGFRSGKPWKMVIALVGYAFIFLMVVGIFSSSKDSNTNPQPAAQTMSDSQSQQQTQSNNQPAKTEQQPAPKKENLELLESKVESDGYVRYIVGTVKNNTSRQYGYVQVEINLYDDSGTQVGSTLANANNLEPGGTWKFKAPIFENNATKYKVKDITGF